MHGRALYKIAPPEAKVALGLLVALAVAGAIVARMQLRAEKAGA